MQLLSQSSSEVKRGGAAKSYFDSIMEEENSNYFTQAHTDTYSSNASNEVPAK
jgi:hypothetical protein